MIYLIEQIYQIDLHDRVKHKYKEQRGREQNYWTTRELNRFTYAVAVFSFITTNT